MIKKKIKIPLYSGNIIIYITDDLQEVSKIHNLGNVKDYDAFAFEIEDEEKDNYYMAFEKPVKYSVIAHESLHITNLICKNQCIKLDHDNDEPQAYLLQWVFEQCYLLTKAIKL